MTKKRSIATLSALAIVIAAALSTAAVLNRGTARAAGEDDSPLLVPSRSSTTANPSTTVKTIPSTSTTHATTTTVDLAKLPHPLPPPADPYAAGPIVQVGSIQIPKIGLLHQVFEGITLTVIDHGPGHWPGSAMPCQRGNAVFPGHRVTHTHPFLDLDLLSPGDQIVFHMPGKDCVYKIT